MAVVKCEPKVVFSETQLQNWIKKYGIKVYREGKFLRKYRPNQKEVELKAIKSVDVDLFGKKIIKNKEKTIGRVDLVEEYKTVVYLFELKGIKAGRKEFSQAFSYLSYYESLMQVWKKLGYIQKGARAPKSIVFLVAPDFDSEGAWVVPTKYENRVIPVKYEVTWSPTKGRNKYKIDLPIEGHIISIRQMKSEAIPEYGD